MTTGRHRQLRRVAASSMVGTTIEWYDFFLFGLCAALVFPGVFFPAGNEQAATLGSFATFGVAFLARPLGAAVFGHFGDRLGRKTSLIATLLLMGIATFCIGLVPSYDTIGIAAPFLLAVLRICQGFALGGEWGGAALLAVEHAPKGRRGFYGVFSQLGNPLGYFAANGVLQVIVFAVSEEAFLAWGWRIGFLFSGVLVLVGLYMRLNVTDAAVFKQAKESDDTAKPRVPLVALVRDHWRVLAASVLLQASFSLGAYGLITYFGSYAQTELKVPSSWVLIAGMVGALASMPAYVVFSRLSDRIGRRPVYAIGICSWLVMAYPFYALVRTGTLWGLVLASVIAWTLGHAGTYAVQSSFLAELFPTRIRYTGVAMSYQLSSVLWSAPTGFVAAWLFATTGTVYSVSTLVAASAVLSLLALPMLKETKERGLGDEGEEVTDTETAEATR
ncbi:MAG: MFS transporter [Streptosporangiales bacterium]|nr:MFS transporter [Streptosporangiales bacterium]